MIITKELDIRTTNKNIGYYNKLGFDVKSGEMICINPEQLPDNSKMKIDVECDSCHRHLKISYYSYHRNVNNSNIYYCNKCSSIRCKETSLFIYGVEHPMQNVNVFKKTKETNLKKYGVEHPSQNDEVKNKTKETCLTRYGETSYMKTKQFKEKSSETNLYKYGAEHPLQSDEIKNKVHNTCLKKYGFTTPLKSEEIKNKISKTKKIKYNDKNYNNRKKYKETCLEIFGFENPMSNIDVQKKFKKSMLEKYGVEFGSQNEEVFQKMLKNGYKINKYKDLYYQGEYELDFLNKYYNIGIKRGKSIKYYFDNKTHIYFPDFFYDKLNLIIEIKSTKWYEENLEKNIAKQRACLDQGYNFIFIFDKNYTVFDKLIKHTIYDKDHSWQYDIRLKNLNNDENLDKKLNISDFSFEYVPETNKQECEKIKKFIEKYEWLGNMPNRPTHRFIAKYGDKLGGVVIMATPNSFSKLLGDNTDKLEKLISRGACASWTPKNLASSLIMWSIKWMVKNTSFRIFTAYSDPEAKELGTIYQACNFYYLGKKYGSSMVYFDPDKHHLGWFSSRYFHRKSMYKRMAKKLKIDISWDKVGDISVDIKGILNNEINEYIKTCLKRKSLPKHKYVYILGKDKRETKLLLERFKTQNSKLINLNYPKQR